MNALQILKGHISQNGVRWSALYVTRQLFKRMCCLTEGWMRQLEEKGKLPGDNSIDRNRARWDAWDWSKRGDEWSSPEFKQSLIDDVLLRYIEPGKTVLEIGPGAGRWTETLQRICQRLLVVDLSSKCIEVCKERFLECKNIDYFVNDGRSLPFVASESIDYIWCFDVFVHISAVDIENYVQEFKRVLKRGGTGVIHHAGAGATYENGWRSNMTSELFAKLLSQNGLSVIAQFDSWGRDGAKFSVRQYQDMISVFRESLW